MNNKLNQEHAICYETMYYKPEDITFIMERIVYDGKVVEDEFGERCEKVINFYYGEPNSDNTEYYIARYFAKKYEVKDNDK